MVRRKSNRKLIIAASIIGVIIVALLTVVLIRALNSHKNDPYVLQNESNNSSSVSDKSSDNANKQPIKEEKTTTPEDSSESTSTLDPETVGTLEIAPMGLTVSYVKGIGGFEYEVRRTPNGSQYIELKSPELAGTKCTNDTGAFASILANPSDGEASTVTKTKTIDGVKYGLSLAATNCTNDAAKLQKYQQSFSDAFSLLKKTS